MVRCANDLIDIIVAGANEASSQRLAHDAAFDPTPLWTLLILFEQLVLFPTPLEPGQTSHSGSLNQEIHRRLRLFRSGQLRELYEESRRVVSKTPSQHADSPARVQRCAQAAADCDNYKSANARLTKTTPVASISDGDDGNITTLEKLYPPSLNLPDHRPAGSTRRTSRRNRKRVHISPRLVLKALRRLNKGKAGDLHLGSLDLFIKIAKHHGRTRKGHVSHRQKTLAAFFTLVANADVPPSIQSIFRSTYLVALQKDPNDLSKLRPLGVPSAIRRVTAVLLLHAYRADFASYLLPYNYAVGVNGGIDVITSTIRLGVERYIERPEAKGSLPSRALVSLDIRNMFNAISRQKLREIMHRRFPELEAFADMIYETTGYTSVKLSDGRWREIPVLEGFAQGCPMSPVFAAIVLNEILSCVSDDLQARAGERATSSLCGDDGRGGVSIIMGYVDDVNALVPLEDVEFFLERFRAYGEPLGAIMNTEKTRILTSVSGRSTVDLLRSRARLGLQSVGESLGRAICNFSTTIKDGVRIPVEVTSGLRVLGAPVGSRRFCLGFIRDQMASARAASTRILDGLDDKQTRLQLFKTCTIHKLTHLFASDVLASDIERHRVGGPWHVWDSAMATDFSAMVDDFIATLTDRTDLPLHAHLIACMSSNCGGLGLQHPRCTAISTFVLNTKRCIEYTTNGVWVGRTSAPVGLPPCITSLYENWRSSDAHTFRIFNCYASDMASICVRGNPANPLTEFIYNLGPNLCKDRLKDEAGARIVTFLRDNLSDTVSAAKLGEIIQRGTAKSLLDMPRSDPANRQPNANFAINLKRKLRLELWPASDVVFCRTCGKQMDHFGDHTLCCHNKTIMHNEIRDGIIRVLKRVLQTAKLIGSPTQVEREPRRILPTHSSLKPFDLAIRICHLLIDGSWRCPWKRIGFDVTVISSDPSSSSTRQAAPLLDSTARLQLGESRKFTRAGHTEKSTGLTEDGDDLIGHLIDEESPLIPIAVNEFGQFGSLFTSFLFGTPTTPLPLFKETQQNARAMASLVRSKKVPKGVLQRANTVWRTEHPEEFYGYSYKAMDPSSWAEQQLGLVTTTAISNHILRATGQVNTQPASHEERAKLGPLLKDGADILSISPFLRAGGVVDGPASAGPPRSAATDDVHNNTA